MYKLIIISTCSNINSSNNIKNFCHDVKNNNNNYSNTNNNNADGDDDDDIDEDEGEDGDNDQNNSILGCALICVIYCLYILTSENC